MPTVQGGSTVNRRSVSILSAAALSVGLACAVPTSAYAAGPGQGTGRAVAGLICPGDKAVSLFAISTASRAWSAASEVGGHRTLIPTSFAVASFTGDIADPSSYSVVDPRLEVLAAKGMADTGTTACVVDGTQSAGEGGFTAIVVNSVLVP
jgi:hypothetical protein